MPGVDFCPISRLDTFPSASHRKAQGSQNLITANVRFGKPAMNSIEEVDALHIAKALGDPNRFAIYKHLTEINEMRCGDICLDTPIRASTVSHHLKVLSDAGLIQSRREGQGVYYRTVPERLKAYLKFLKRLELSEQASQRR